MVLRIIEAGNSLPHSYIVDPTSTFQPGQVAELTVQANQVVCTVSKGLAPIGIIDDIKTKAFTAPSWNETKIVPATGTLVAGKYVTTIEVKAELDNAHIDPKSFSSTVDCQLIARNGVIIFPEGTELNVDILGTGIPNAIKTIVNYTYQIPNMIGDDSTIGSNRVTVWFQRMIAQTDMFETNQQYPVNANLFVSESGLLTTRQATVKNPAVAIVTAPPTASFSLLEFLWL